MNKRLVAGLTMVSLITVVGVVFASTQTDSAIQLKNGFHPMNFWGRHPMNETLKNSTAPRGFCGQGMSWFGPFATDLTAAQQEELKTLVQTMQSQNATPREIQAAIQQKLDEYGVFDRQLSNEINSTEQRLQILNREQELRAEGYSWENITTIIQQEFNVTGFGNFGYQPWAPGDIPREMPRDQHGPMARRCPNK